MSEYKLQQNQKHFVVRKNHRLSDMISPIERWPDKNYVPLALDHVCIVTPTSLQITAPLHGCAAEEVHVDLSRRSVIILVAPAEQPEFYCEVSIPADMNPNVARVDINGYFMTIQLDRNKRSVIRRVFAEIRRLKPGNTLLPGIGQHLCQFDDGRAS